MLTDEQLESLDRAWAPARSAGVIGAVDTRELATHAAEFAALIERAAASIADADVLQIVDVGTGAGLPGVVVAALLPHSHVTLVDASERRLDFARSAARALSVLERTSFLHSDAAVLGHDGAYRSRFDFATARLLADPAEALELLLPLVCPGGELIVSASAKSKERWSKVPVYGLATGAAEWHESDGTYFVVVRRGTGDLDERYPRSKRARRQQPLI